MTRVPTIALLLALGSAALGKESDHALVTLRMSTGAELISARSGSLRWTAKRLDADRVQVQLQVPVESFDSGRGNFDSLLRAAFESDRYPLVDVEGILQAGRFEGTITAHGITRPLEVPVEIVRAGDQLRAVAFLSLDLEQFAVSLPAAGRHVAVEFSARLSVVPHAVLAGGAVSSD